MRERSDGLDMVRAVAMLLGITSHAAMAYVPDIGRWYFVQDVSTAAGLDTLQWLFHAFRMQVFFVLSGLFAHLVLGKRGPDAFLADRFRRLGGTDWLVRPLHLWFLGYLFLYIAAAWALVRLGLRAGWLSRAFGALLRTPELFLALSALSFASVHCLGEPNPAMRLAPEPASLLYYLPFFVFGWLVWGQLERAQTLRRAAWLVVPGLALGAWVFSHRLQFEARGQALAALVAWLMVLGCLGLALHVRHAPRPALRSLVEASYWVYLVHHPLVVSAQIALATRPWNAWLKYALVVIGVAAVSLGTAPWVLRRTFLERGSAPARRPGDGWGRATGRPTGPFPSPGRGVLGVMASRHTRPMRSMVGLAVVVIASGAWAQSVYTWTDAEGTTHYTNDPASIPKNAKVTATAGADVNVITAEGEPDPPLPPAAPKSATAKAAAAASTEPEVPSASELEWRQLFRDANLKIRELQDQIEADKNVVEQINGMPITGHLRCGYGYITPAPIVGANSGVSVTANGQVLPNAVVGPNTYGAYAGTPCWYGADPRFERIRQRLARNRIALERAKEDLADLERQASFASVPREWRR